VTIPTTNKATTETPANTPRPIGKTSSFFPGGSKGSAPAALSEEGVADGEDDVLEDEGKIIVDDPVLSGRELGFPGCEVGSGMTETGGLGDG